MKSGVNGELKFKQLVVTDRTLTGLADDGSVWTYCGKSRGWAKLNMQFFDDTKPARAARVPGAAPRGPAIPAGWDREDEVPF